MLLIELGRGDEEGGIEAISLLVGGGTETQGRGLIVLACIRGVVKDCALTDLAFTQVGRK